LVLELVVRQQSPGLAGVGGLQDASARAAHQPQHEIVVGRVHHERVIPVAVEV
jgi:hypothetical protein